MSDLGDWWRPDTSPRPVNVGAPHRYLSTACLHGKHDKCRKDCKFCAAECSCVCHRRPPPVENG